MAIYIPLIFSGIPCIRIKWIPLKYSGIPLAFQAFSMRQLNKPIKSYITISMEGLRYRLITDSIDLNEDSPAYTFSFGLALFSDKEFVKFVYVL